MTTRLTEAQLTALETQASGSDEIVTPRWWLTALLAEVREARAREARIATLVTDDPDAADAADVLFNKLRAALSGPADPKEPSPMGHAPRSDAAPCSKYWFGENIDNVDYCECGWWEGAHPPADTKETP